MARDGAKEIQRMIRERSNQIKNERRRREKDRLKEVFASGPDGKEDPKTIGEAVEAISEYIKSQDKFYSLVAKLDSLFTKEEENPNKISPEEMETMFLTGKKYGGSFSTAIAMVPPTIALIALNAFLRNGSRFEIINPNDLPYANDCSEAYEPGKITHTAIEVAGEQVSVPVNGEYWVRDLNLEQNYIISYGPTQMGGIALTVHADYEFEDQAISLVSDIKDEILKSPMIRGRVLEITAGDEFTVSDFGPQPEPIMNPQLREEIQKNVINLFTKRSEFEKYGLGLKRSLILCGPPGCGKTMIERWAASQLSGQVTTLWVTSKAVRGAEDVRAVFDMARKLSPALIVMEDLDLISGTRNNYDGRGTMALGEMLNQLDGLSKDDAIVLIGSTNRAQSLDEALSERPGRFDRIYEVGRPEPELAKRIAYEYLRKRNVDEETISSIDLSHLASGAFTGAQIVEIVKGAIFEAVARGGKISTACVIRSVKGLEEQRKLFKKE